jgi:dihydrofolate reductase
VDEALALAGDCEIFVAGGEEIYRQTLDRADRLHITRIDRDFEGDARFPEFDPGDWRLVFREDHPATDEIPFSYSFLVYDRAEKGEEPV